MLRTGKQVWEATAKRSALEIRKEELDFHISRYTILVTQCSVLTGFSFESIIHLEDHLCQEHQFACYWFYSSCAAAVMTSVYVIVVGSCLIVLGMQLALLGQHGDSLEKAVHHMRSRRVWLFFVGFLSLFSMISAAVAIAWVKMGDIAFGISVSFVAFLVMTMWSSFSIFFAIGKEKLTTGSTKFFTPTGYFDLAMLQPGVGNPEVLASHEKHPQEFV